MDLYGILFTLLATFVIWSLLMITLVLSWRDTWFFLKTGQWPHYPNLDYLEKTRFIFRKEVGNYYYLEKQGLYADINYKKKKPEWRVIKNFYDCVISKLVTKDSVTIDEEGVAHYVTTKDPIEI